jgi:hypothetical protein
MRHQATPESPIESRRLPRPARRRERPIGAPKPFGGNARQELPTGELAFRIFAAFRAHPHINNVLTHISRADWTGLERSLGIILDLATTPDNLSSLEQNIIDLMCADRGITGRILKPYFHAVLHKLLDSQRAERLIRHIQALFRELERRRRQPAPAPSPRSEPSKESGHASSEQQ